jgi:hypothetical protein
MGDSTSVPVDTARRLLEGILYCLSLAERYADPTVVAPLPTEQKRRAGAEQARRLARRAKFLLKEATRMQPPVVNRAFRDTLSALPVFFRQYDPDFFAQEIPCSFDYPLCQPVPDSRAGVEYILDYLRRWLLESSFLRAFPADAMIELYERYYVDYEDLLVNLYQPAAEMAVLCALADEPVRVLWMEKDRFEIVRRVFTQASEYAARQELLKAADRTLNDCGITGTAPRDYLNETALNLIVRLRAAFAANGADQEGMQNRLWISERSF